MVAKWYAEYCDPNKNALEQCSRAFLLGVNLRETFTIYTTYN
jgi:hypothetical protein